MELYYICITFQAIEDLTKALEFEPNSPDILHERGYSLTLVIMIDFLSPMMPLLMHLFHGNKATISAHFIFSNKTEMLEHAIYSLF